jgi:hypothetical protein
VPIIAEGQEAQGKVGEAFSKAFLLVDSENRPATVWSATGLPDGLSMNPATGQVAGVPQEAVVATIYLTAEGPGGEATVTAVIAIFSAPSIFCPQTAYLLPIGQEVSIQPYSRTAESWKIEGIPPVGFVFNQSTGGLYGSGTLSGVWNTKITAINPGGQADLNLTIGVYDFLKESDIKKTVNINITTWDVAFPDASTSVAGMARYNDYVTFDLCFFRQAEALGESNAVSLIQVYPELYRASFSVKGNDTEPAFFILDSSYFKSYVEDGNLRYEVRVLFSSDALLSFLSDVETDDGTSANCLCEFEFVFRRFSDEDNFDIITTKPFLMNITRDLLDK